MFLSFGILLMCAHECLRNALFFIKKRFETDFNVHHVHRAFLLHVRVGTALLTLLYRQDTILNGKAVDLFANASS